VEFGAVESISNEKREFGGMGVGGSREGGGGILGACEKMGYEAGTEAGDVLVAVEGVDLRGVEWGCGMRGLGWGCDLWGDEKGNKWVGRNICTCEGSHRRYGLESYAGAGDVVVGVDNGGRLAKGRGMRWYWWCMYGGHGERGVDGSEETWGGKLWAEADIYIGYEKKRNAKGPSRP
jgi:hypothetical protein